ncbi:hypothetical protein H1R20_g15268, partial [Candolleomyces eurysporus]
MHSSPFPSTGHCACAPLDLIHTDLCGPLSTFTREEYRYWCVFIDDHTCYQIVVLLKRKSDMFTMFKQFKALAENQLGRKIEALHDDKGGDTQSTSAEGDAERANRTMLEDITAMLTQANLSATFWGRCLAMQVKVWNCLPTASLPGRTPFEAWVGRKPDLSCFRAFGCTAYVFIQKDKCKKLESHMQSAFSKQFIISDCAEFDERVVPGLSPAPSKPIPLPFTPDDSDNSQTPLPRLDTIPTPPVAKSNTPSPAASPAPAPFLALLPPPPAVPEPTPQPPAPPVALRRSQREMKKPGEWWKRAPSLARDPIPGSPPAAPVALPEPPPGPAPQLVPPPVDNWEPRDPSHAVTDSDDSDSDLGGYAEVHAVQHWEAATEEILTLIANGTWELVELPPGEKTIPSGWVLKTKRTSTREVERYKGRVVAKGCSQCLGIDYDDTYYSTFRAAALRTTVAAAGIEDMELRSVAISAAFTNGDLEEVIYMRQPEGFHEGGPNVMCRLKKSLYGLRQAARQWNKKLHSVLLELGFTRLRSDRSVYIYAKGEVRIIMPVYIDNVTLASKDTALLDQTVLDLSKHFKLRDLLEGSDFVTALLHGLIRFYLVLSYLICYLIIISSHDCVELI